MNAQWVTAADFCGGKNYYFQVRKSFSLDNVPDDLIINISADSNFRLYINDKFVGCGPVRGSTAVQYVETYPVAEYLHTGENIILIEVYSLLEENFVLNSIYPGVIAEIPGVLSTDGSWLGCRIERFRRDVPHYTMQSGFMEYIDFSYGKDEVFQPVRVVEKSLLPNKKMLKNTLPLPRERSFFPTACERAYALNEPLSDVPCEIPAQLFTETQTALPEDHIADIGSLFGNSGECEILPTSQGVGMILDFNREISGRVEIELDAPAGTAVQIAYGEALTNNRIATQFNNDYHFTDCFITCEGKNIITTAFAERGFRMIQISFRKFQRPIKIKRVSGIDRRYPFVSRGRFFSSDYLLNRIYSVCEETLSACSSDVFMDCPWRERAFWVNDLLVNNSGTLHCFGASELHRHCFEMAFSQQHESGLIPAVVPRPCLEEEGENPFVFAPTNLFMILALQDYWMFSKDDATVLKMLEHIERILDSIWDLADKDGILRSSGVCAMWNFYDWSFEQNRYSCDGTRESMLSSLFVIAAKTFSTIADQLGYSFDRALLESRWRKTAANVEKRFISSENGLLEDEVLYCGDTKKISTQLAHALWLLTGEVSAERKEAFEKMLADDNYLMPDYYLHYFWFKAAALAGHNRVGLERIRKYWGRCIATGSPTLYEAGIHGFGQQAMDGSGSLCHGFGTIPVVFVHEAILGVRPLKSGFEEFSFSPDLMDLEFASGRIPLPDGRDITVQLDREKICLAVPAGTCAVLPDMQRLSSGTYCWKFKLFPKM